MESLQFIKSEHTSRLSSLIVVLLMILYIKFGFNGLAMDILFTSLVTLLAFHTGYQAGRKEKSFNMASLIILGTTMFVESYAVFTGSPEVGLIDYLICVIIPCGFWIGYKFIKD